MADKAWKANERAYAKFMSDWLGVEVRRNDAIVNAGDRAHNSDVDVEHPLLQTVWHRPMTTPGVEGTYLGGSTLLKGITAELKYRTRDFKLLYRWIKKDVDQSRKTGKSAALLINDEFLVFRLQDLPSIFTMLVQGQGPLHKIISGCIITHVKSKNRFVALDEGSDQAARYGRNKKMFPIQVIRMKGERQLVVIRMSDMDALTAPYTEEEWTDTTK